MQSDSHWIICLGIVAFFNRFLYFFFISTVGQCGLFPAFSGFFKDSKDQEVGRI